MQERNYLLRFNTDNLQNQRVLDSIDAWEGTPPSTAIRKMIYDLYSIYEDELSRFHVSYSQAEAIMAGLRKHAFTLTLDPDILPAYLTPELRTIFTPLTRVQALAILDGARRYWWLSEPLENIFPLAVNPNKPKKNTA